jgi:serine/threonine-protein kinase HipA
MSSIYTPQDTMFVWCLANPAAPRLIGQIVLADSNRRVAFAYDKAWLLADDGFALSEDLPLRPGLHLPEQRDTAAGAIEDARPDQWGERVIRLLERPARLSLLEYLYFAGDERFGALGISLSGESYQPRPSSPIPSFDGLQQMEEVVARVLAGDTVPEGQRRLLRPGASFGGARPKSLLEMDGQQWLVKFSDGGELDDALLEHATMQLAKRCGIHVAQTRALPLSGRKHALAVKRFDRVNGLRLHCASAYVALRAAGEEFGYPELAQWLRRNSRPDLIASQQEQLFRRMVFNILIDNTDDHEKNHVVLRQADGSWQLSAAFDIVPSAHGLGYQQMRVGEQGAESSIANALSSAREFGLGKDRAVALCREISPAVNGWKAFFDGEGLAKKDIEQISNYVDGAWLIEQRQAV